MRFTCKFQYSHDFDAFIEWLVESLESFDSKYEVSVLKSEYVCEISIRIDDSKTHYTVGRNPKKEGDLFLKVVSKLGFLDRLRGKNDIAQEKSALLVHQFLSDSEDIFELGWYETNKLWKASSSTP